MKEKEIKLEEDTRVGIKLESSDMDDHIEVEKTATKKEDTKNEVVVSKEELAQQMGLTLPKNFSDVILNTVANYTEKGSLNLPAGYNYGNALKGAMLILQQTKDKNGKPLSEVVTKESVAQSMLEMVIQGLDPTAKQNYFIVRGNQLTMMRSYFGSVAVLKRLPKIKDVWATIVYEKDVFEIDIDKGREIVAKHETSFENKDGSIKGAYAVIEHYDGTKVYTIMTKKEIDMSWSKSSSSGGVSRDFPQEMAKRTVINRAVKLYINTETENSELVKAYNNTLDNEYQNNESVIIDKKEHKVIEV